ncbi:flavodoxin family protein [Phytoactinopolyspora halotolerans]|uniref:Flavodoxin n=1 Tax=Phytoactinopolyspora halotolerans TaxID=1981512 RepID=A0A6L9SEB9_9ACTN|nr:flavodoxin domain-containing protein [Phytoactinopolyspora halotolerans]NEE03596.1 flavodoxin [Phytoactinopolyspora halotolerans]
MDAWVVYESMFGNTKALAEAIAAGLAAREVRVLEVGEAPLVIPATVGLLIVGCPTHAFGMSRASTREEAAKEAPHGVLSARIGVREWFDALERDASGTTAAVTFDTRVNRPRLPGSAAAAAEKRLKRLGFATVARPMSFYVHGKEGPLVEGEIERATEWAAQLGTEFMPVS